MKSNNPKRIKAEKFDQLFEKGDITPHLKLETAKLHTPFQRINIDIPQNMLKRVDQEADRIGIPRTALIKMWISERVDQLAA